MKTGEQIGRALVTSKRKEMYPIFRTNPGMLMTHLRIIEAIFVHLMKARERIGRTLVKRKRKGMDSIIRTNPGMLMIHLKIIEG